MLPPQLLPPLLNAKETTKTPSHISPLAYFYIATMFPLQITESYPFSSTDAESQRNGDSDSHGITKKQIRLALTKQRHRVHQFPSMTRTFDLVPANGSAKSIILWGAVFRGNRMQRRAFEAITASFVLSCIKDAIKRDTSPRTRDTTSFPQIPKLRRLAFGLDEEKWSLHNNDQLLLFLHGPRGSGKSTVVNMVLAYCKEYYEHLGETFTNGTIIGFSVSGANSTLIGNETTHGSILHIKKTRFRAPDLFAYEDTKLLVVHDISSARNDQVDDLYSKLQTIKQQYNEHYGGINACSAATSASCNPWAADSYTTPAARHSNQSLTCS